jgi:mRNA interferase MazF
MTKGKVVLVPFPFDDLSGVKVRPALCLTEPIGRNRHVVEAFLTSRIDSEVSSTDIVLDPSQPAFADLGQGCIHSQAPSRNYDYDGADSS